MTHRIKRPLPDNVTQFSSVQAADQVFKAPPKDPEKETGRGETKGPYYHNPYKGMKI